MGGMKRLRWWRLVADDGIERNDDPDAFARLQLMILA